MRTGGVVLAGSKPHALGRTRILRFRGEENVLVVGPARSGKGIGVIIPSLLDTPPNRPGHAVVVDVRGETWEATAGYRSTFSRCLRLSLRQPGSARFSLPQAIRKGTPDEFMDAAIQADVAMEPGDQTTFDNPHWHGTGKAALTCALLYEVHTRVAPTMAHMASFWSTTGQTHRQRVEHILATAPSKEVAELAQELLNKEERELSSVLSTMTRQLFLYRDPHVARNTATCDFQFEDFTHHERWTSLYLVLSPEEQDYLRPFMRAFLRVALGRWLEIGATRHNIVFILDEFPSFGRLEYYVQQLGVLGGRGIRTVLAMQNIPQLRLYGDTDRIVEQCRVRVFFAAQGQTTGREISRQTGTGTATTLQTSYRADGWSWLMQDSRYRQEQQHARALLTESEAMQIPDDRVVVQVTGHPPIWGTKLRYWEWRSWRHPFGPDWRGRSALTPPQERI
jgi:type IV secretion system protein VirD4